MAITKYQFLDETGIQSLSQELLGKVNLRISGRIQDTFSAEADENHVLSAKKVYELIGGEGTTSIASQLATLTGNLSTLDSKVSAFTHLTIELVVGDLEENVDEPASDVLYFHKDSEEDPTWDIYIYQEVEEEDTWICVGDTSIDLANYWAKNDIDNMKTALGMHDVEALTAQQIKAKVDAAYTATEPDFSAD